MKISIIGGGYVGLVSAVCFADMGHFVNCIEKEPTKFNSLSNSIIPFYEPELTEKMSNVMDAKRLTISNKLSKDSFDSDVIMLAVGTPMFDTGEADLTHIFNAVSEIISLAQTIDFKSVVLTTKSTVPVGTGKRIKKMIDQANLSEKILVASNPEFLREGSAVYDFFHPDRIIIGTDSVSVFEIFKLLYKGLHKDTRPIAHVSLETAELAKYASNTFLATKISFINELAILCDNIGADIKETAKLMGMDGRIGKYFLNPSPGYGGSCFPKDTHALQFNAKQLNINLKVLEGAIHANNHQIHYCFSKLVQLLDGKIYNKTITILGTSFKPNTDDIRESASLKLIDLLLEQNVTIHYTDPKAIENTQIIYGDKITPFKTAYEACKDCDGVILMTEWNAYRNLDLIKLKEVMNAPNFIDFRIIYSHAELNNAGFNSYILGKGIKKAII
ncbi:MAG: UDP-glucose dehydrogenase family protein [Candidatus Marinamargulisbacteria bacterium]